MFNSLGLPDGEEIEHKMLSSAIEKAQKRIENNNYGIRKNLLEYDKVNNDQREIIYTERRRVLDGESMRDSIFKMITDTVEAQVNTCMSDDQLPDDWDLVELNNLILPIIPLEPISFTREELESAKKNSLIQKLKEDAIKLYEEKEAEFPEKEQIREIERVILLKVIDRKWMDHIDDMDQLRQGIGLQAYGQRDPLVEFKFMGFEMFDEMTDAIREDTIKALMHVRIEQNVEREQVAKVTGTNKDETVAQGPVKRTSKKIQPNDPCPCGSGKKYKYCCGKN
jgi:preprotein translocase subunit SecA